MKTEQGCNGCFKKNVKNFTKTVNCYKSTPYLCEKKSRFTDISYIK